MKTSRNKDRKILKMGFRNHASCSNRLPAFRGFIGRHYNTGARSTLTSWVHRLTIRSVLRLMEDPMRQAALLLPLGILVAASMLLLSAPADQVIQGPEVEQFLKKARFVAKEPLGSGVTASLKVTLELDGKSQFAVLKTVDQKRPGAQLNAKGEIEIDFQDSWRTEVAAYELDKLLGLGMVPATIERTSPYDNQPASLQLWVEASMSEAKRRERAIIPPNADKWSDQLIAMNIFDALIYNTDRHPGQSAHYRFL